MIVSQILSCFYVYSHSLSDIHVLEVKESITDISTELPILGDLENPGQLPIQQVLGGTCLIDFHSFFIIYVFEVKKSITDTPTELPCLGDLENLVNFRFQSY